MGLIKKDEEFRAVKAITAYRQLDALGLFSKDEADAVKKKIISRYGEHLNILRQG